ncbi:hypothetical protein C8R47DRAFT_1146709 [Mycena vitilis]|nr:hypothetical protein C8R47DRAFT_1146709 [Mycena vitilis]
MHMLLWLCTSTPDACVAYILRKPSARLPQGAAVVRYFLFVCMKAENKVPAGIGKISPSIFEYRFVTGKHLVGNLRELRYRPIPDSAIVSLGTMRDRMVSPVTRPRSAAHSRVAPRSPASSYPSPLPRHTTPLLAVVSAPVPASSAILRALQTVPAAFAYAVSNCVCAGRSLLRPRFVHASSADRRAKSPIAVRR